MPVRRSKAAFLQVQAANMAEGCAAAAKKLSSSKNQSQARFSLFWTDVSPVFQNESIYVVVSQQMDCDEAVSEHMPISVHGD